MKTYAYLRVSTDAQDYQSQRHQIDAWIATHDQQQPEYISDAASGAIPWQQRTLASILDTATESDQIVVSEVSRIARSVVGVLTFIEHAMAKGITVIACRNNMTFGAGLQSKVTLTILALAAEIERELIRDRTKAALAAKRARGEHLGRQVGQVVALKLDGRRDEILRCLAAKVSKRAIARMCSVSPTTLHHWITRNLTHEE
jgi:DNA invertase Pin-like site-specific DNA recombinase